MPTKISLQEDGKWKEMAWLCGGDWHLPRQVAALREWLSLHITTLPKGDYAADIGFAPRADAGGGGAAITLEMMRAMNAVGMTLHLSEYPEMGEEADDATA
jgi:hypothetical protein